MRNQRQLDVYGELLDSALLLKEYLKSLDAISLRFFPDMADAAARSWMEKDEEGGFLMCTFRLAHVLAMAGRNERAREVMEETIRYSNDVGLFSEEIHPATGELLGNFPQAFSHIGFVNAAWAIAQSEQGKSSAPASQA